MKLGLCTVAFATLVSGVLGNTISIYDPDEGVESGTCIGSWGLQDDGVLRNSSVTFFGGSSWPDQIVEASVEIDCDIEEEWILWVEDAENECVAPVGADAQADEQYFNGQGPDCVPVVLNEQLQELCIIFADWS